MAKTKIFEIQNDVTDVSNTYPTTISSDTVYAIQDNTYGFIGDWDLSSNNTSSYTLSEGSQFKDGVLSAVVGVTLPTTVFGPYIAITTPSVVPVSLPITTSPTELTIISIAPNGTSIDDQLNHVISQNITTEFFASIGLVESNLFDPNTLAYIDTTNMGGIFTINILDGVLTIDGYSDYSYIIPDDHQLTIIKISYGFNDPTQFEIIGLEGSNVDADLPEGWKNGSVYRVTGAGTYAGKSLGVGDFVIIIEDGADLIVVHADKAIDVGVDVVALLANEQAARMAADEAERLARINADLSEQLARQSALSSLQTSMTAQLQTVANQIAASRAFFIIKIVGVSYPNGESVSGADVYYLKQGDWYILNRKDGLVGGAEIYQHVYQWNGNASGFVVVPQADVYALQNNYEVMFNARNNLFFGDLYQDSDGWMYNIKSALNNPAGDTNTYLNILFSDPAKQVTGGYMSLEHVQRLQAVESLAQVNNLNLGDKAGAVEVDDIAAQVETNRLALLTKADITAITNKVDLVQLTKAQYDALSTEDKNLTNKLYVLVG